MSESKVHLKNKKAPIFLTFVDPNKIEQPTAFTLRIVAHTLLGPFVQSTKSQPLYTYTVEPGASLASVKYIYLTNESLPLTPLKSDILPTSRENLGRWEKNTAKRNTHSRVAYIFQSPPTPLLLLAKVLAEAKLNKTCVYSAIH